MAREDIRHDEEPHGFETLYLQAVEAVDARQQGPGTRRRVVPLPHVLQVVRQHAQHRVRLRPRAGLEPEVPVRRLQEPLLRLTRTLGLGDQSLVALRGVASDLAGRLVVASRSAA